MLCACGCDNEVKMGNRYVHGHNRRGIHYPYRPSPSKGKTHPGVGGRPRLLSLDLSVFENPSPHLAYLLGLLATDGNVSGSNMKFVSNDRELVNAVTDILSSGARIREYIPKGSHKPAFTIVINSKALTAKLANFGIVPRKSLTLCWPPIPDAYQSFFVRGVFDGDGSVHIKCYDDVSSMLLHVDFVSGSKLFADTLATMIHKSIYYPCKVITTYNRGNPTPHYRIHLPHNPSVAFYHWIYADMTMPCHMFRKKLLFETFDLALPVCRSCGVSLVNYHRNAICCSSCVSRGHTPSRLAWTANNKERRRIYQRNWELRHS